MSQQLMAFTNRIPIYDQVHKGIRKELFDFIILAGTTQFNDAQALENLQSKFNNLINLLRDHARHEDQFIHPLLKKNVPEMEHRLEADHVQQDLLLNNLCTHFDEILKFADPARRAQCGHQFYQAMNYFVGEYLLHLHEEEHKITQLLWQNYSDEEILNAIMKLISSFTIAETRLSYAVMLPALNPDERVALFNGLTTEKLQDLMSVAGKVLSTKEMEQLKQKILL